MNDNAEIVLTENDGGVRTITLNRPNVLNAFNDALLAALAQVVREAGHDASVRCLVITGAGRGFSSGHDVADMVNGLRTGTPIEFGSYLPERYNPIIARIRAMEKPVVAAVNGVAAGAGCSLALACDLRIAAESASFIQAFVKIGLIPDAGGTFMLPRLVGPARAMELAFTGRPVRADEAMKIGLVNRVVPDGELRTAVSELAQRLAALPTRAIALAKRAINTAWNADLDAQLDLEATLQARAADTHDYREGVDAFVEKRLPNFKGK